MRASPDYQNVNPHRKLIKACVSGRMLKNAKEIELGENKMVVLSGILRLYSVMYYGI
jgi:hypothetical protein